MKAIPGSLGVEQAYEDVGICGPEVGMAFIKRPAHGRSGWMKEERVHAMDELEPRALLSLVLPPMPTALDYRQNDSVVTADFDGDGLTDLAASRGKSIKFYRGLADGTFAAAVVSTLPAAIGRMTVGRFNGDQRPDIASIAPVHGPRRLSPPIGLLVRAIYFDPATSQFAAGARMRVGDAAAAQSEARIASGDFVNGWRDEIVVGIGSKTDIRLLQMPDRGTMVLYTVLLNNSTAALRSMAVGTGLPGGLAGHAQVVSVVAEAFSSTVLVTSITAYNPSNRAAFNLRTVAVESGVGGAFDSVAIGDLDGDGRADVVLGGEALVLVRNVSASAFAPRIALQMSGSVWHPHVNGVADVDGDGRADVVFSLVSAVDNSRINSTTVAPSVALARGDGSFEAFSAGLGASFIGTAWPLWDSDRVQTMAIGRMGSLGRVGLVGAGVDGLSVSVATDALFAPVVFGAGAIYDKGQGGTIPKTGVAYADARDQDRMRGGHVVRVEFVVDLNHSGAVDGTDPVLCVALTPPMSGSSWTAAYTVPDEWATGPYTLFARAIDDDGLASAWGASPFAVYPA